MREKNFKEHVEIYSKVIKAGRRTYFFDVRETKAGDYYFTITESKKYTREDGSFGFDKKQIYLYKEDFNDFKEQLNDVMSFIIEKKGETVISDRHREDYVKPENVVETTELTPEESIKSFTDVKFEDI